MSVAVGIVASATRALSPAPPVGYVTIPATSSNALKQTPDDNPTITDLVITARLYLTSVPGSGTREICERWVTSSTGTNRFIFRFDATAKPVFIFQQSAATQTRTATVAWPFASGVWGWIRMTFTPNNGSSQHVVLLETSADGNVWTVLDTVTTGGVASIDNGAGALAIGNRYFGSALGLNGGLSDLKVVSGGATLFETHAATDLIGVAVGASSFISTSGHTVSVLYSSSPALVLVPPPSLVSAVAFASGQKYTRIATGLTGNMTWCAWAKLAASTATYSAILSSDDASSNYNFMGAGNTGTGFGRIMSGGDNGFAGATFTPGVWTFVACVHDTAANDMMYFFPAGGSLLSQNASDSASDGLLATNTVYIADWGFGGRWNGSIACVRIWNAVLTQAELLTEMSKAVMQRTANAWASYNFTAGPQTLDNSGNGRTLTAVGIPTLDASGPPVS